jgi:hypothetical protein
MIIMPLPFERFQGRRRNSTLIPPIEALDAGAAHLLETIDNIGDFFRFVDGTIRSEVSSREFARLEIANRRSVGSRPAMCSCKGPRRFLGRRLTLLFRLTARSESD